MSHEQHLKHEERVGEALAERRRPHHPGALERITAWGAWRHLLRHTRWKLPFLPQRSFSTRNLDRVFSNMLPSFHQQRNWEVGNVSEQETHSIYFLAHKLLASMIKIALLRKKGPNQQAPSKPREQSTWPCGKFAEDRHGWSRHPSPNSNPML